jgi:hypothetical protein
VQYLGSGSEHEGVPYVLVLAALHMKRRGG